MNMGKTKDYNSSLILFEEKKKGFLEQVKTFNEADTEETNEVVKRHLEEMVGLIEDMESDENISKISEAIRSSFDKVKELSEKKSQAFVFFLNDAFGEVFLSSFGPITIDGFINTELSLPNRMNNEVVEEVGPIKIPKYEFTAMDVMQDEVDGYELEFENDDLNELLVLKAYSIFEKALEKVDYDFSSLDIIYPFYIYIQEHDGGDSNLLKVVVE